ncbi:YjjG family noncanonical pyrimidine nucleotidase [Paenibacillus protaetiae]|uniref:Noncanonical pyrimidine nucleotidase, YjjG family n=1 Tax=Paenibacillus protaetiae TaxID=2509456 RepID=A0A4P6EXJ6_9BACL|nr:YjjG family noncanonical pyrimidine nucleotidase [Paenibacillus protaetiae]QAY65337.1 noncanonical pyrimidine nucleotidase, YjjG family [Paenibacillus protaetiae]
MNYKAILFDLDNTLLNYSVSEIKSMQKTVEKHGLIHKETFSWNMFWNLFSRVNLHYWSNRQTSGYNIYQILEHSFQDTLKDLGLDPSESGILAKLYWNTFCRACDFEDYAKEVLFHLHGKYKLAIISNGIGEAQRNRLAAGGINHFFDALIISDEVGYWKPDKKIFDETLTRLDIKRTEALFIGDSLHDDYNGAINAGIDFCYYNRNGSPVDNNVRPKYVIDSLRTITAFLGD